MSAMLMRLGLVSLALFAGTLSAQQTTQPSSKPESCSIEGQVTNALTGEPLKKVAIDLWHVGNAQEQRYGTTTTAGGRFVMQDIEPGQYRLSAQKRGYAGAEYGTRGGGQSGTILSLDPGQHLGNVVLRMSPQAVITGHALDDDGEPLPNVAVFLLRYDFSHGKRQLQQWDEASTNDLGEYRMFGLSPGQYYLSATASEFRGFPQGYDSGRGYVPTYYPATSDPAGAKAIELHPGTVLRGMDITLLRTRTVRVRGHVMDTASKQPARNVGVSMERRGDSQHIYFYGNLHSQVDAQGNFEIKGVTPGAYFLEAFSQVNGKQYRAQQALDVRESDIENIVLELNPPGELKGRLRIEGRSGADLAETQIWLEEEQASMGAAPGRLHPDGTFTITEVQPARYQLSFFRLPDGYFCKSARIGDQDVLESGLDLTQGIGGSLEITLSGNGGQVEGVVLNASDQPESGATVVLVPDEPRRGQSRLYKDVTTDQYGRFTIKGIAAGGYKLFAWEEIEEGAYESPDFIKTFDALGEPRTIREGSRESAQLKLIPAAEKKTAPN